MSNALFPTPAMPNGSYTWPIIKYPEFSTIVLPSASTRGELAKSLSVYPLWQFDYDFAFLLGDLNSLGSAVQQVVGFHMQMRGAFQTWLFNDPYDNSTGATPVQFATGDGSTKVFQITRPIAGGVDIVQNINGAPAIYVGGVLQLNTAYSISTLGVITFVAAPGNGLPVAWNGSFYFRCRFNDDKLSNLKQIAPSTWELPTVQWHSVIL